MKELFGQRLREQRQNQGLTMEQLAEKANLSTNFIGAIERGLKEPSLSTLISILNALDIPADVLLRDYVGTASHVTDEEICKRLEGLTPIQKFLSTPSAGRATAAERPPLLDIIFLSTPSAGRATSCPCTRSRHPDYFYPRPPRGGRPVRNSPQLPSAHISIHALREEGDGFTQELVCEELNFYPRPP